MKCPPIISIPAFLANFTARRTSSFVIPFRRFFSILSFPDSIPNHISLNPAFFAFWNSS